MEGVEAGPPTNPASRSRLHLKCHQTILTFLFTLLHRQPEHANKSRAGLTAYGAEGTIATGKFQAEPSHRHYR